MSYPKTLHMSVSCEMDEVEIPQYFLCPISLQMMKDPVTTITGITYDRESIEEWLSSKADEPTCPVTKQPLSKDSDLTPNHILRRLIQAWCVANADNGVDRIPTPKSPLSRSHVLKIIRELGHPQLYVNAVKKLEGLAMENERNRKLMVEAGLTKSTVTLIIRLFKVRSFLGLQESLNVLHQIWVPTTENKQLLRENFDQLIQALMWALTNEPTAGSGPSVFYPLKIEFLDSSLSATALGETSSLDHAKTLKKYALLVLKHVTEVANSDLLGQLKPEFFVEIMGLLRLSQQFTSCITKSALHILKEACPWGRNRSKIIVAGGVFELVELGLSNTEKSVSELVFSLLANLCSSVEGRAQLLKHAGGIAMVAKRILRVSPATDDRALHVLELIARFSGTSDVVQEMLRVGAVSKLCMVLQADSESYLKKKAREILRLHSSVWNNSPCIQIYLLTRYPR